MNFNLNNMSLLIRKMKLEDIDEIMPIEASSYGVHHWSKNAFINELNNNYGKYFVCNVYEPYYKILGYIGYWLVSDEGHITTLAVSLSYRRIHIADILLYFLIKDAQLEGLNWLTLEVRTSNLAAIKLYKKYNFKELGIRKKYYQDNNEDAIILWTENINIPEYNDLIEGIKSNILKSDIHTDKLPYCIN